MELRFILGKGGMIPPRLLVGSGPTWEMREAKQRPGCRRGSPAHDSWRRASEMIYSKMGNGEQWEGMESWGRKVPDVCA